MKEAVIALSHELGGFHLLSSSPVHEVMWNVRLSTGDLKSIRVHGLKGLQHTTPDGQVVTDTRLEEAVGSLESALEKLDGILPNHLGKPTSADQVIVPGVGKRLWQLPDAGFVNLLDGIQNSSLRQHLHGCGGLQLRGRLRFLYEKNNGLTDIVVPLDQIPQIENLGVAQRSEVEKGVKTVLRPLIATIAKEHGLAISEHPHALSLVPDIKHSKANTVNAIMAQHRAKVGGRAWAVAFDDFDPSMFQNIESGLGVAPISMDTSDATLMESDLQVGTMGDPIGGVERVFRGMASGAILLGPDHAAIGPNFGKTPRSRRFTVSVSPPSRVAAILPHSQASLRLDDPKEATL
jgi:hypothetical protein